MKIIEHLDGQALTQWFAPENDAEKRQLKEQIYRSLADQNKMPLSKEDFMQACTDAGDGVFVYTAPPDLDNIHVCMAVRGTINTVAIEPPGSWHG